MESTSQPEITTVNRYEPVDGISTNMNGNVANAAWMKPSQVLSKLKAKKRALKRRMENVQPPVTNQNGSVPSDIISVTTSSRRCNPFSQSLDSGSCDKHFRAENDSRNHQSSISGHHNLCDTSLFDLLRAGSADVSSSYCKFSPSLTSFSKIAEILRSNSASHSFQRPLSNGEELVEMNEEKSTSSFFPVDWSLKYSIRIVSKTKFPWSSHLKTVDEASAMVAYSSHIKHAETIQLSRSGELHSKLFYWQYPDLPWLKLFPRDTTERSSNRMHLDSSIITTIKIQWADSLRSLFMLVKSRQCPYFYVCASSFICLVRAAGIAGVNETHACITPTTSSFLELLASEDIQFQLSSVREQGTLQQAPGISSGSGESADDPDIVASDEGQDEEDDETIWAAGGVKRWLDYIGLESVNVKISRPGKRRKMFTNRLKRSASSTIIVPASSLNCLLNFLLNNRACCSSSGDLSGIPPTLISPLVFVGASLKQHQKVINTVRMDGEDYHQLSIAGPIHPTVLHSVISLMERSLTNFQVDLRTVKMSEALTHYCGREDADTEDSVFCWHSLADCGLDPTLLNYLCLRDSRCLGHIDYSESLYTF